MGVHPVRARYVFNLETLSPSFCSEGPILPSPQTLLVEAFALFHWTNAGTTHQASFSRAGRTGSMINQTLSNWLCNRVAALALPLSPQFCSWDLLRVSAACEQQKGQRHV